MIETQQEKFDIINLYNSNDLDLNKNLENIILNYNNQNVKKIAF